MKSKIFIGLLFFSLCSSANAATTGSGKVETMMNAYGGWIFQIAHANDNPNNCEKAVHILKSDHSQHKEIYSLLLAAHTSGKAVTVFTNVCDSNGYAVTNSVYIDWGKNS